MSSAQIIYIVFVTAVSIFGCSFLIRDILIGKTKLNLVTWFFWALAPLVGTFLQLKAGAGLSVLPVFFAGFFPIIIFIIALVKSKTSYWKITTFDILCGIFSFLALVLWVVTQKTGISILFAILADLLAGIPTLIKSWKFPETETAIGYFPGIINNMLGLLLIKNWNFSTYSFSIYFIVMNTTLFILINRKKILSLLQ